MKANFSTNHGPSGRGRCQGLGLSVRPNYWAITVPEYNLWQLQRFKPANQRVDRKSAEEPLDEVDLRGGAGRSVTAGTYSNYCGRYRPVQLNCLSLSTCRPTVITLHPPRDPPHAPHPHSPDTLEELFFIFTPKRNPGCPPNVAAESGPTAGRWASLAWGRIER